MSTVRSAIYFVRLGRPLFLFGGFGLYGLGVLAAVWAGATLDVGVLILGQVAVTSIQLMTHYSNDYFDLQADKANQTPTAWSGGSRILVDNLIDNQLALRMAVASGALAMASALLLAANPETGFLTLPLLLLSIGLAWSYSSPPLALNNHGLGEVGGAFIITGLTPVVGYYLQAGGLALLPFLTVFSLCCVQFAMLLMINFPDAAGDDAAGKHTLVVLLGPEKAARLYLPALILAYGSLPFLWLAGLPFLIVIAILIPLPLAVWLAWRMKRAAWSDSDQWNSLGFWSVALLMGTIVSETAAYGLLVAGSW